LRAIVGLGIPLSLVTMAGQNATGLAVIRAAGYGGVPASPMITVTGLISVLMAPFGAHGINLAAITAAICTGPEAHPNSKKRYPAGIICGLFYILVGSFGATLEMLLGGPVEFVRPSVPPPPDCSERRRSAPGR
jgi:benzoate membrane transport protein